MNAIGKRRLLKLADFLSTAKISGKFDMSKWSGGRAEIKDGKPMCGTVACAFGWATTIPSFRRAGLTMGALGRPLFNSTEGRDAAVQFFGIDERQAEDLFEPDDMSGLTGKRGRNIVAKRIRKLCAKPPLNILAKAKP